jgi:phenylacetate-CoA ligase
MISYFKLYFNYLYPKVFKYYEKLKSNENLSKDELINLQIDNLNKIINYARNYSPFYKNLWEEYDAKPRIKYLSDFDSFPLVTKEMLSIAQSNNQILTDQIKLNSSKFVYTTGSTGLPFGFPIDVESAAKRAALELRSHDWYNFKFGYDKRIKFWRSNLNLTFKDRLREFVYKQKIYSIYDPLLPDKSQLNEERAEFIIKQILKYKPSNIDGFVSSLTFLAKYIIDKNIKFDFNLCSVVTGAEYLSTPARELIETAFQVPVYNRYGGTESGLIAHESYAEAKSNHFLHISEDSIYCELYKNGKSVDDGDGSIVFTDFSCFSFPFIKYQNGDVASFSNSAISSTDLPFKFFTEVKGRINDFFLLPNGNLLSGHIWHNYFREAIFIKQFQIIQEEINLIKIYYVINEFNTIKYNDFNKLKHKVHNALSGCSVLWEEVNSIDNSIGGKYRHSMSKLNIDINKYSII